MNEVIVLTGSTGRIGNALAKKLHEDFTIVGLDIVEPDSYHIDDWLYTDFTDTAVVKSSFNSIRSKYGRDLRAVVHLVAIMILAAKKVLYTKNSLSMERDACWTASKILISDNLYTPAPI